MAHHLQGIHHMSTEMQECITNCQECHAVCTATTAYCLQMGGKHAEPKHIRVMMDSAELCAVSENFMLRMSDMHPQTCGVCADACEACAQSCEQFGDDAVMQQCAETCRRCAASCRSMEASATTVEKNSAKNVRI